MALNGFLEFFQREKTFRPKKRFTQGTIRYSLHKQANASLQSGINLKEVVKLPPGENMNDWLAVHVVDFFNRINLIYGTISEYCNETTCKTMSGGAKSSIVPGLSNDFDSADFLSALTPVPSLAVEIASVGIGGGKPPGPAMGFDEASTFPMIWMFFALTSVKRRR
uniref:MOB kinase activator-like 3 n=1 Tax=Anopheles atroparvus TaxID=41427 RepID=A0A182JBH9_ANOAO